MKQQKLYGVNRWVSELGLSDKEARVFDVLYNKSSKKEFRVLRRADFFRLFQDELVDVSQPTFYRCVKNFEKRHLLRIAKRKDGLYLLTGSKPLAEEQEIPFEEENVSPVIKNVSAVIKNVSPVIKNVSPVIIPPAPPLYKKEKIKKINKSSCFIKASAEASAQTTKTKKYSIPSFEEVKAYAINHGSNAKEAKKFFQYYSANGWMVGKNRMACWEAALAWWIDKASPDAKAEKPAAENKPEPQPMTEEEKKEAEKARQRVEAKIALLAGETKSPGGRERRQLREEIAHTPKHQPTATELMAEAFKYGRMVQQMPAETARRLAQQKYPEKNQLPLREEFMRGYGA